MSRRWALHRPIRSRRARFVATSPRRPASFPPFVASEENCHSPSFRWIASSSTAARTAAPAATARLAVAAAGDKARHALSRAVDAVSARSPCSAPTTRIGGARAASCAPRARARGARRVRRRARCATRGRATALQRDTARARRAPRPPPSQHSVQSLPQRPHPVTA